MYKLLNKLIKKLEKFEKLSEQEQLQKIIKLKKSFPHLKVFIRNEEIL